MKFKTFFKKSVLSIITMFVICSNVFALDYVGEKLNEIEKYFYGYTNKGTNTQRLAKVEQDLYGQTSSQSAKNRVDKIYKDMNLGTPTAQESTLAQNSTQKNTYQDNIGPKADAGIKYPIVDKLEKKVFNKSYENDDIYNRLSRLEKQVFKKESSLSLNERVDALRERLICSDKIASVDIDPEREEIILEDGQKYIDDPNSQYNYYSYENSKNHIAGAAAPVYEEYGSNGYAQNYDLDILEKQIFGKRFAQDSPSNRLARLESTVFQHTFNDGEDARIQRLLAVTTAQKTSQEYDTNKWARRLNTGMQIGSILLMVLAMIL